jgi:hypothetical protein
MRTIDQAMQENIGTNVPTIPLDEEINQEHHLARSCAETAVQHAVRCGELLVEQKARLEHGEFGNWIAAHCEFSQATANNYMRSAQNPNALGISIRHLFPSGRKPALQRDRANGHEPAEMSQLKSEPAGTDILTVEQAIGLLEPIISQRQIVSRFRGWRSKVGKLRTDLRAAEMELADAEATLIKAALKLQAPA